MGSPQAHPGPQAACGGWGGRASGASVLGRGGTWCQHLPHLSVRPAEKQSRDGTHSQEGRQPPPRGFVLSVQQQAGGGGHAMFGVTAWAFPRSERPVGTFRLFRAS